MRSKRVRRGFKAGLPPGTLIHIGERTGEAPRVTVMTYDEDNIQETALDTFDAEALASAMAVTWVHVDGLDDVALLEAVGNAFSLHPLTLEDILNTEQRPKTDDYGTYTYTVLKALHQDVSGNSSPRVQSEQVSLVLLPKVVLTFAERGTDLLLPVRERIRLGKGRMRREGADYLAYAILDAIVDRYFLILEGLGDRIDEVEELLVGTPHDDALHRLQLLKREMIYLRRSIWPLREAINTLEHNESGLVETRTRLYLKDVHDHTIQVIDTIETYRDLLSGMLDVYLSSISNRLSQAMKVLTGIATIFMPLTFLAGVYGMNFEYMPELKWRWGYFMVWGVMLAVGAGMYRYFRRKKWL